MNVIFICLALGIWGSVTVFLLYCLMSSRDEVQQAKEANMDLQRSNSYLRHENDEMAGRIRGQQKRQAEAQRRLNEIHSLSDYYCEHPASPPEPTPVCVTSDVRVMLDDLK